MNWKWSEIETVWKHPDWTAKELAEILPHSAKAIRNKRSEIGRYNKDLQICCKCDERPVWLESPQAKRYQLCKGCFLDEERMRLEDNNKAMALRQRRRKARKRQ